MLRHHILRRDELLDIVDGEGLVHRAAGAFVLAVFPADRAADRGERIVPLDELEGLAVLAVARHLDIALDRDVQRAGRLARRGSRRPGLDDAVFVLVVPVPLVLAPDGIVRQLALGILDLAVAGAQLLAKAHRACGAYLDALAAGHAVFGVHLRGIRGPGHIRRVEKLGRAQGVADADGAVAQAEDLVFTVDVRDLVDVAALLRLLQDLHGLFVGDVMAHPGLAAVVGKVADADAPVRFDIAGTLSADALLLAAGADAHADMPLILLEPVRQVLDVHGLALGRDGLLHRDDVHADARAAGRHKLCDAGQRQIRHALKEVRHLRRDRRDLRPHDHDLRAAGNEHIQHPALLVVRVFAVQVLEMPFHQARLTQRLQNRFQVRVVLDAAQRLDLRKCLGLALSELQRNVQAVVRHFFPVAPLGILQAAVDAPVFRRLGRDLLKAQQDFLPVRDDLSQFCDFFVSCHRGVPFFFNSSAIYCMVG